VVVVVVVGTVISVVVSISRVVMMVSVAAVGTVDVEVGLQV
jgi:hypothetical protein